MLLYRSHFVLIIYDPCTIGFTCDRREPSMKMVEFMVDDTELMAYLEYIHVFKDVL